MKIILCTAFALVGMAFSICDAIAVSPGISSSCNIIQRNGTVANFSGNSVSYVQIIRTPTGTGTKKNVNASCELALAPGKAVYYNFQNTGISCVIDGVASTDWLETVYASGETYLACHIVQ